ncbi:NAD(P)/FAD-dependent oxidoreductase [Marinococcus sp. PL1-022]|uniref:dihydrolipoyl dehydrogenase family protein n=1 Tax=Marinococcus sp. PL1-022 TaxID=3095363 RepID=UPI0029C18119|nr:NAD(P)/FAD-dependent oxidoreductase [Marinococcus sp. PL1-022]MDX6153757.1 NAD(P)/FAD-dependent oxidoreductase [Marinococcus sp. PL1-022]
MPQIDYDLIVLGGGSGGLTVASGAAQFGMRTALVDDRENLGGECLHAGCIPSKAFVTVGREIQNARKAAEEFGLQLDGNADFERVKERVRNAVADVQELDDISGFEALGIDVYMRRGEFMDPHHLYLEDGSVLGGKRIVIATGSSPNVPPIENLELLPYYTNETIFEAEKLPEKLVCVGGGPVGMELAQTLARIGSSVTAVDSGDRIFSKEEKEIAERAQKELEKEIHFIPNTRVVRLEKENGRVYAVTEGETEQKIEADALLLAAGRVPNTNNIGLEKAGVRVKKDRSVDVSDTMQTSVPHIYAIGDASGGYMFTHAAGMEGQTVVSNAVFGLRRKINYNALPWAYYTEPEIFHLGVTEEEAKQLEGVDVRIYRIEGKQVDRFLAEGDPVPLVKIITDQKGNIIGAHAVGRHAADWMQQVTAAKTWKKKLRSFSSVVYPYPAHGDIVKKAADEYWRKALFNSPVNKVLKKYVAWFR